MQTVETVLQIDKTVKQTDESEFNFFLFQTEENTLFAHTNGTFYSMVGAVH